jgi:hypothetical protein
VRFGAVVHERFFKPGMLEGFFRSNPFLRIVYEYALEKFEELPIEGSVGRYCLLKELLVSLESGGMYSVRISTYLKLLHLLNILP